MRLQLTTWNGHDINDGTNYEAIISPGNSMPSAEATFIDLGQDNPVYAGKSIGGGYFTFFIVARGSIETQRDELNDWFDLTDSNDGVLIAEDLDDSNKEWYLEGHAITPPIAQDKKPSQFSVTLALKQPYWIEADEQVTNWNISADTETQAVTNNGNVSALPKFEITPAVNKGSNTIRGRLYIGVRHVGWEDYAAYNTIPIDLTPAGWNTATLVTAGDMLSSGNDIAVSVDGVSTFRWLEDMNTSATHVWANVTFKPAPSMTLQTALDNSTLPSSIVCGFTASSITLPQNSTFQIGSEFFTYSTLVIDNINKTVTFTPTVRGAKGSTKATHSVSDAVYWIEHDIWISYGNLSASAPVQDDRYKPSMDLNVSANDEWVWTNFNAMPANYGPGSPGRSGAASKFTEEDYATTGQADPYEVLGLELHSVQQGDKVFNFDVWGSISVSHPGNIIACQSSIEKWRNSANFGQCKFYVGDVIETIASPSVVDTWEAVAINITATTPSRSARLDFRGGLGTTLPVPIARVQMFSISVTIDEPPTVTVIAQDAPAEVYRLGALIENETTDEGIQILDVETEIDETTTIDCLELEAYKQDGTRIRPKLAFTGERRNEWLTLAPGSNTIRYTDTGTNDVDVVIRVRGRNTI